MSENTNAMELMWRLEQELGVKGPANVLRAALALAKEAAAQAKEAEPAAPPAWMVEVAREAAAQAAEGTRHHELAVCFRAGTHDDCPQFVAADTALRLALERGHVVEARPVPSEEEMLRAAREDAAQALERDGYSDDITGPTRIGYRDCSDDVQCALQARRNVFREWGAVAAPVVPAVDLETALKRAWEAGFNATRAAVCELHYGKGVSADFYNGLRSEDVSLIASTLPTREA